MNNKLNLKILYVEDEPETRHQMEKFLKRRFSRVVTAANGIEGLKKFSESSPDIIIADLLMDELGGIEMVQKIREAGADCRILITSALEDTDTILRAVDLGIDGYIIKPIDTDELDNTLEKTALQVLKQKGCILNFDITEKKEIEKELGIQTAVFLKKKTGKGPKNINVFIGGNSIEVGVTGFLTAFDESLLADRRNQAVVEQNRKLFLRTVTKELTLLVADITGIQPEQFIHSIDIESNHEVYTFKY